MISSGSVTENGRADLCLSYLMYLVFQIKVSRYLLLYIYNILLYFKSTKASSVSGFILCVCVWYWRWKKDNEFPGTGPTDGYKLPYGCWEPSPSPQEEKTGLLTTEPFLQPCRNHALLVTLLLFIFGSSIHSWVVVEAQKLT